MLLQCMNIDGGSDRGVCVPQNVLTTACVPSCLSNVYTNLNLVWLLPSIAGFRVRSHIT